MTIQTGDKIPATTLKTMGAKGMKSGLSRMKEVIEEALDDAGVDREFVIRMVVPPWPALRRSSR